MTTVATGATIVASNGRSARNAKSCGPGASCYHFSTRRRVHRRNSV